MHWLIHLQILLLFAVPFIPAFIVGCFEKRAIRMFEAGEMKVQTRYLQLMTDAALAHGFTLCCTGHHIKYKKTLFAALYLSTDRTILALIAVGSIGAFRQAKTLLMSRFKDGSIVITINDAGMIELDAMTHRYILINAGFDELLAKHLALMNQRIGPSLFPPTPIGPPWTIYTRRKPIESSPAASPGIRMPPTISRATPRGDRSERRSCLGSH
jgi:hypothetical protein